MYTDGATSTGDAVAFAVPLAVRRTAPKQNMRPVTWCVVEEVTSGDCGIAGKPLHTADVRALAAGVKG